MPRFNTPASTFSLRRCIGSAGTSLTLALLTLAATGARADVVFSDDFDSAAYSQGTVRHTSTDRWVDTDLSVAANGVGGWIFSGNVLYLKNSHSSDGAISLNENDTDNSASHQLTGLVVGKTYALNFLRSGDNRPGQFYGLYAWIDADLIFATGDADVAPGSTTGWWEHALFTAKASTATLKFSEYTFDGSQASPVIDNVSVSLPEPASISLVGISLLGLCAARRRLQR
jgi:hypothetical protein